jgi:GTP-binding protein HflX
LLHVSDISHPEREAQRSDVNRVLADLGVEASAPDSRVVEVWNKLDRLGPIEREEVENAAGRSPLRPALVSARTGEGIDALLQAIDVRLAGSDRTITIELPPTAGKLVHWLHDHAEILDRRTTSSGATRYKLRIDEQTRGKLWGRLRRAGLPVPTAPG